MHHTLQGFVDGVAIAKLSEVGRHPDLAWAGRINLRSDDGFEIRHSFILSDLCTCFSDEKQEFCPKNVVLFRTKRCPLVDLDGMQMLQLLTLPGHDSHSYGSTRLKQRQQLPHDKHAI